MSGCGCPESVNADDFAVQTDITVPGIVAPASMARRARTEEGKTDSWYSLTALQRSPCWAWKPRTAMPFPPLSAASRISLTSDPDASKMAEGFGQSRKIYPPLRASRPVSSYVGRFCRLRTRQVGPVGARPKDNRRLLFAVGRTIDRHARRCAQRGQMFDRFMCRTVLADTNAVMGHN